jgi:hypothetical protein
MDIYIGNVLCNRRAVIYDRRKSSAALKRWKYIHPGTACELVDIGTSLAIYWSDLPAGLRPSMDDMERSGEIEV